MHPQKNFVQAAIQKARVHKGQPFHTSSVIKVSEMRGLRGTVWCESQIFTPRAHAQQVIGRGVYISVGNEYTIND